MNKMVNWFDEYISQNERRSYRIREVLYEGQSKFHSIKIYDLYDQGITLVINEHARVFEIDEFIYHEGFVHAPIARRPSSSRLLVIGDGDGGLVREIQKYTGVQKIDWVEIDEKVIESCEQHLPSFPCSFRSDDRVSLHIKDGVDFIKTTSIKYDVVYNSVSVDDDCEISKYFKSDRAYKDIKRILKPGGLVAHSLEEFSPSGYERYVNRMQSAKRCFRDTRPFSIPLPSFGSNWGFVLASDKEIQSPANVNLSGLRFYNRATDNQMFTNLLNFDD